MSLKGQMTPRIFKIFDSFRYDHGSEGGSGSGSHGPGYGGGNSGSGFHGNQGGHNNQSNQGNHYKKIQFRDDTCLSQ